MKLCTVIALASIAYGASAQTVIVDRRMGGFAANSAYNRLYNQRSQLTFTGVVTGIQHVRPMADMETGVTLLVKNDDGGGTAIVELGPDWFVDRQTVQIKLKDRVTVTGSKILLDGRGIILAKLVQKGAQVLALRRPSGVPYWDIATPIVLGPDPNVTEITGTLEEYQTFTANGVPYSGLALRTGGGNLLVDLGPQWFIEPQGFTFPFGSTVTIATSGTYRIDPYTNSVPAYWIRMNGNIFQFRSNNGMGVWQGWRPGTP
ncbi:MAG TPA: hypothetical protein VJ835_08420 [Fimbriimonadaceae bacterium]|nr:hypothetical protein [Fimbriimonadaceae bacterium]